MTTSFDVQRVDTERVRILVRGHVPQVAGGEDASAPSTRKLLAWLGARGEVVAQNHRAELGVIEVTFKEPKPGRGRFLRALKDRVFTLDQPDPAPFTLDVAHELEGRVRLRVGGLSDDDLVRLAAYLAARPGVHRASPSPAARSILVLFDPAETGTPALLSAARSTAAVDWPAAPATPERHEWQALAFNTAVLAATATGTVPVPAMAGAIALTAIPSAKRAWSALAERHASVDLLDLAAIGISLGTGQPLTAAFITWLLGLGDVILAQTTDRARAAISKLMQLDADDAWRITDEGGTERVSVKRLAVGDRILVATGGRIAADGIVESGVALVDEKALTGESVPVERRAGERVLAASVVVEGQLVIQVDRTGTDTTAAKIVQILEGAGAKPMTLQRETERIADQLVLPTFGVAGAAALFASQIDRMTSVLITDFGTGIRIAVPTAALAAMTGAAREGVLVKGGQFLERLAKVDAIVFDKTGTLTGGAPQVFEVVRVGDGLPIDEVLTLAAGAEARQGHPVAEAVRRHAKDRGLPAIEAELGSEVTTIGAGLSARVSGHAVLVGSLRLMKREGVEVGAAAQAALEKQRIAGGSSLFVAVDGVLEAVIGYADEPRPESVEVVRALRANGRRQVILMSGDAQGPVAAVAARVGVDRAFHELLPEDKAAQIKALQREGKIVAMVGDGINDAPALAVADVGISLEGGTDVALETADVVLLEGGLKKLPDAFASADRAMAHVRRGLGLVLVPNAIAIALGAAGLITPGIAAAVNNGSTIVAALAGLEPLLRSAKPRPVVTSGAEPARGSLPRV